MQQYIIGACPQCPVGRRTIHCSNFPFCAALRSGARLRLDAGPASATLKNLGNIIVRPFEGRLSTWKGPCAQAVRCRYHSIHSTHSDGKRATRVKKSKEPLSASSFKIFILLWFW